MSQIVLNVSADVPKLRINNPKKPNLDGHVGTVWVGGHLKKRSHLHRWTGLWKPSSQVRIWSAAVVLCMVPLKAAQFTRKSTRMASEPGEAPVVSIGQVENKLAWPEWLVQIYRKWENVKVIGAHKVTSLGVTRQLHDNDEWWRWGWVGLQWFVYFASPIFLASVS